MVGIIFFCEIHIALTWEMVFIRMLIFSEVNMLKRNNIMFVVACAALGVMAAAFSAIPV